LATNPSSQDKGKVELHLENCRPRTLYVYPRSAPGHALRCANRLGAALREFCNILEFHIGRGVDEPDGNFFAAMIEYRYILDYFRRGLEIETVRIESLIDFFSSGVMAGNGA